MNYRGSETRKNATSCFSTALAVNALSDLDFILFLLHPHFLSLFFILFFKSAPFPFSFPILFCYVEILLWRFEN
ncbi:hypothetical protein P3X46_027810 [Hevea brasiliensis]|uniref:Uncharacterized protein n=1 Tax=Hevea brasiliensis TaxID=3981 RepID=A0ABQ9L2R1_HEVBR|nr:hypothetical protein P3X46_027810 [Hevea brasiliensis]